MQDATQNPTQDPTWNKWKTWPNGISVFRLLLGMPLFYAVLVVWHHNLLAIVVYAGFAVTDNIDGWVARHHHMSSKIGEMLDPTIDVLYAVFATILIVHTVSWWILAIVGAIIVREAWLSCFFAWLRIKGIETGSASYWGKKSRVLTNATVAFSVLPFSVGGLAQLAAFAVVLPLAAVATALSWWTAGEYVKDHKATKRRLE